MSRLAHGKNVRPSADRVKGKPLLRSATSPRLSQLIYASTKQELIRIMLLCRSFVEKSHSLASAAGQSR